ncbi:hypothetical protein AB0F43_35685 [Kribbella sp. NPDC023972]|uniref:hypothetical protein n=1 Tax=Kribbella sp. NPDC023972 TaxID=3154795 RepID=UPI0033FE427B
MDNREEVVRARDTLLGECFVVREEVLAVQDQPSGRVSGASGGEGEQLQQVATELRAARNGVRSARAALRAALAVDDQLTDDLGEVEK